MKFLMVSNLYPPHGFGGAETQVQYLSEELVKRGHEVHVLFNENLFRYKLKSWQSHSLVSVKSNVLLHEYQTRHGKLDLYKMQLLGTTKEVQLEFKSQNKIEPDITHYHNVSMLGYRALGDLHSTSASLYTAHDYWLICQRDDFLTNGYRICTGPGRMKCTMCGLASVPYLRSPQLWRSTRAFRQAISRIDLVIAPSNYMAEVITRNTSFRTVVLPNFVPPAPIITYDPGKRDYFLFAGILRKGKGILNLIKAFEIYSSRIGKELVVIGDGPLRGEVTETLRRRGLKNIHYLGWQDRHVIYGYMRYAAALVIPSIMPENCPLVALEAYSVGLPVIGSDRGGTPEIVNQVDRKLVYDAGSSDALSKVLSTYDRKRYSSKKVQDIYLSEYSPSSYIERYLSAIRAFN